MFGVWKPLQFFCTFVLCGWCYPSCPCMCVWVGVCLCVVGCYVGRLTWFFFCLFFWPVWTPCWCTPKSNKRLKTSHCLAFHTGLRSNWFWQLSSKRCAGQEPKRIWALEPKKKKKKFLKWPKTKHINRSNKWVRMKKGCGLRYCPAALEARLCPAVFFLFLFFCVTIRKSRWLRGLV